ncbi:MAG: Nif3-like dinuclear metal center hexameric protein [Prevotellaceae bacterium]|jgi:dinuclear metal center YbgI/SA1388 family protein|nr:Nif3-like dinuclear metal center hexameric protein [Prevotellaceae bacterium]
MTVKEIVIEIEKLAPTAYQESYDNTGLTVGESNQQVSAILLCFDVTEDIVDEAVERGANLIISHHPAIFNGLKRFNNKTSTERIIIKSIKNNIALYAAHTNLDSVFGGISSHLSDKLGLINQQILVPKQNELVKLVTFVPVTHADTVRKALFDAQAGYIGNYDCCSYNIEGDGTFRANECAHPFIGKMGEIHTEPEIRIETIVKRYLLNTAVSALLQVHPYEEVAYDVYPVENVLPNVGLGIVGNLPKPMYVMDFLQIVKNTFRVNCLRYNKLINKTISRVAVCGGAGASFINNAILAKADIFITGDCKYHQFIDASDDIVLVDIGHYESEYSAMEIFNEILNKKFPNFAVYRAEKSRNPINFL